MIDPFVETTSEPLELTDETIRAAIAALESIRDNPLEVELQLFWAYCYDCRIPHAFPSSDARCAWIRPAA